MIATLLCVAQAVVVRTRPNLCTFTTFVITALLCVAQVVIMRAQPSFCTIATVPIAGASCAEWALRQLYVSTATHVYCVFVSSQVSIEFVVVLVEFDVS